MPIHIHHPELHFAPENGILDAPAGALLDGTTWHLYFQYRAQPGQGARWGHVFSEEMPFDWLECDDVLAPAGGEITLRAGAVAAVDAGVNLYFTSVTSTGSTVALAQDKDFDRLCEVSDDPSTLDAAIHRVGTVAADTTDFSRFRSPCVVPGWAEVDRDEGHAGWIMLALTGTTEAPQPVILHSEDGTSWTFSGPLTFAGDTGLSGWSAGGDLPPVVSPRIIRLRDQIDDHIYDVLLVTIERGDREVSGYLVGRLEGTVFSVRTGFQQLDFGHDFTRPRTTNYMPGTVDQQQRFEQSRLFGLMNGQGRADDATTHPSFTEEGWANVLSLPRHVTLQGGKLFQTPAVGLPDAVAESSRARSWVGLLNVPAGSHLAVELLDADGDPAAVVTHSGEKLTLKRCSKFQDLYADDAPATASLAEDDSDSLTIIIDGSTVEVFADGGQVAMASRVYFTGGCGGLRTSGDAEILREWERAGS